MNWININVAVIDSEAFLGAEPTERATWLCLQRYCAGQENGGRIDGAKAWKDRKWQQVVRVTLREVSSECDLWRWEGDDLIVEFYPTEKEAEVQRMRSLGSTASEAKQAAAKANGAKGGRPTKNRTKNPTGGFLETQRETQLKTHEKPIERKGIGKEGNGKEALSPTSLSEPVMERSFVEGGRASEVMSWINTIRGEWRKPAHWNHSEQRDLFDGTLSQILELNEADRRLIEKFMREDLPKAAGFWQPHNRSKFVQTFAEVFSSAQRWADKKGIRHDPPSEPKGVIR